MPKVTASRVPPRKDKLDSFTLVELLTVMVIISILAAIVLFAASGVRMKAARSRTAGEIQAISSALDSYKTDNGIYPYQNSTGFKMSTSTLLTNSSTAVYLSTTQDGTGAVYKQTSQVLYLALSGQTNFTDTPSSNKAYMSFNRNQVGDPTGASSGASYIQDTWGNSYGYNTTNPFNGSGLFDLWSTGSITASQVAAKSALTNSWISNWR